MNRFLRVLTFVLATTSLATLSLAQIGTRMSVAVDRTNVRAQPSPNSEVLASLNKGQVVEVLGAVTPARGTETWSRIRLPSAVSVWVYAPLVDTQKSEIKAKKLNYRAGPGRNYSVLGELKKGDPIKAIRNLGDWLQIDAPPNAVAYIASRLLGPETVATQAVQPATTSVPATATSSTTPPPTVERTPPPVPPSANGSQPTTNPPPQAVTSSTPLVATPPTDPPVSEKVSEPASVESEPSPAPIQTTPPSSVASKANSTTEYPFPRPPVGSPRALAAEPKKIAQPVASILVEPRFVVREGVVERTISLQAPTDYELRDGFYREGLINYLLLEPQKELRQYSGKRVMVSGFEYLDSRWSTPVLRVQNIQLMP